jgi:hypothetical protein
MIGLMTLWFGPFVDIGPDYGYFHLCPACYREFVKPHLDHVQGRLAELHPLARQLGLHTGADPEDELDPGDLDLPSPVDRADPEADPEADPDQARGRTVVAAGGMADKTPSAPGAGESEPSHRRSTE